MERDKEEDNSKGKLGELIQETDAGVEEREEELDHRIRILLAREVEFDRRNSNQQFYFQTEELGSKDMLLKKLGWKVMDLEKEQEDLAYFCFNLLAAQIKLPLNIFTNSIQNKQEARKSLWMEISVHSSGRSRSVQGHHHSTEVQIYRFCEYQLLPLLRAFVSQRITWAQMSKPDYNQETVIQQFKKEVIDQVNEMIKREFRS